MESDSTKNCNNSLKYSRWFWRLVICSCLVIEKRKQEKLTQYPTIYHQDSQETNDIVSLLSSILLRKFRPSLFIGTRSMLNTISALLPKPPSTQRIREIMTISYDGATIALDWELPGNDTYHDEFTILNGPIKTPIVLILHGVNNDTTSGYMRGLMNSCNASGYIAVGMNSRGSGGISLNTPRLHNAAYTNDLRDVVRKICSRMEENIPMILIGYSMGANTLVKYLGECGSSNTLPTNVIGAASLGNPFKIDHSKIDKSWSHILTLGAKKTIFQHRKQLQYCPHFQKQLTNAFLASSLADLTSISVQQMIRNSNVYPFQTKVGYKSNEEYWHEASSYRYISNVTIPLIVVYANDDDICNSNTLNYINYGLANPHVIFINTSTGGHLGWHHAMRNNPFGSWNFYSRHVDSRDWGTTMVIKFVDVVINKMYHQYTAERKMIDMETLLQMSLEKSKEFRSKI